MTSQLIGQLHTWQLFVDGASRNNPGPAGAGIYVRKENKPVLQAGFYLGTKTNNQAEYLALLLGLLSLRDLLAHSEHPGQARLEIISDSLLLIKQLQGEFRVKHPGIIPLHACAQALLRQGPVYTAIHTLRHNNTHADALANAGIDKKIMPPTHFMDSLAQYGITL